MIRVEVLGCGISAISWAEAIGLIREWALAKQSRVVCICNSHSIVTARSDAAFKMAVEESDMATADGAPVAFMMSRLLRVRQERINGPDLMWRVMADADQNIKMFLYGSSEATLRLLRERLERIHPHAVIVGAISPPFRDLIPSEEDLIVRAISDSDANLVWVSLGCPKQEKWMARHKGRVRAVMIGVGAAFDYHAGTLTRAPLWMQRSGLEWAFRLSKEPRRLWRRYFYTNTVFLMLSVKQLLFVTGRRWLGLNK